MVKNCNVESCTRFTVTQWLISVALLIMIAMQSYIIKRVDKIELNVKEIQKTVELNIEEVKTSVEMINSNLLIDQTVTMNNEKRVTNLETQFTNIFLNNLQLNKTHKD